MITSIRKSKSFTSVARKTLLLFSTATSFAQFCFDRPSVMGVMNLVHLVVDVVVLVDHVVSVLLAAFSYYVGQRDRRARLRREL
jgi:hypothetical protein